MFVDDVKSLRSIILENLTKSLGKAQNSEDIRAQERTFFMAELEKNAEEKAMLEKRIESLKENVEDEKRYNNKLFVRENVTQIAERAYFSYKLIDAKKNGSVNSKLPSNKGGMVSIEE